MVETGWFVGYRDRQKATAIHLIEWQDDVEVVEQFDGINTLVVEGDEETIRGLTSEWYITDIEEEGVGVEL